MPTNAEVAWAAGLFEGEGSAVSVFRSKHGYTRMLALSSSDLDVLERLQQVMGGSVHEEHRTIGPNWPAHYKQMWQWRVTRWEDIERIGTLLLPWLLSRRRAAMELLLSRPPASREALNCVRCGAPMTPGNLYVYKGHRNCKRCAKVRDAARYVAQRQLAG